MRNTYFGFLMESPYFTLLGVPKVQSTFRISPSIKAEFERAVRESSLFETGNEFIEEAIHALILQHRRGEGIKRPLEFVSDRSSDKIIRKNAKKTGI